MDNPFEQVADQANAYSRGWDEGYKAALEGIHNAPWTPDEWDEAHQIQHDLTSIDDLVPFVRDVIVAGGTFACQIYTPAEGIPYDVSAECHDFQFDCDCDVCNRCGNCPCICGY